MSYFQLSSRCLVSPMKHHILCLIYMYYIQINCPLDIILAYLCYYCEWNTQVKWQKKKQTIFKKRPGCEKRKKSISIFSFTAAISVTWHLNGSDAGGDLVLIKASLFLFCKSSCPYTNQLVFTWEKAERSEGRVTSSTTCSDRPGN